jgi:WD40 repeat protein
MAPLSKKILVILPVYRLCITYVDLRTPQVWEVNTGVAVTSPLLLHSSWVTDVAIAADGSTLLTAGDR